MKSAVLLGLACILAVLMYHSADAATARCSCSGRCGNFSCPDPNNTRGCNCVSCTCTRGSVGYRQCCQNCGFWNTRKCFTCQVWQSCGCNGCR